MRTPLLKSLLNPLSLMASLGVALLVSACGGGVDSQDKDDHVNVYIDTAGRLAVTEANASTVRIHDLDSGSVEASHVMTSVPSAVYASPGGRYARRTGCSSSMVVSTRKIMATTCTTTSRLPRPSPSW
jgi:hypothetical protein